MYFSRLNYKYLEIYHEIIKHVIWLGRKIEVNMVLDLCEKILWIICQDFLMYHGFLFFYGRRYLQEKINEGMKWWATLR